MSDNAEEGIARTQATAARGRGNGPASIAHQQERGRRYIGERIVTFLGVITTVLLLGVWAIADSPLVLYGSLALVVCLAIAWGAIRIRRMEAERTRRMRQAASYNDSVGKK